MTTHYGTSHRTLPERPAFLTIQHLTVTPLPDANAPMPRRQHKGVCPFLTIDGKPANPADFTHTRKSFATMGSDITNAYCSMRPGGVAGPYVLDVCVTSWHHDPKRGEQCPFYPAQEQAA